MKKQTTKKTENEIIVANAFPMISSFTIKATIPTGQYANIQPELTVNDVTFDEIDNVIMPKIEAMFMKYHNYNEKIVEMSKMRNDINIIVPDAPSMAFTTASNALTSAKTPEAKEAIKNQIKISKKLTEQEIAKLLAQ